MLCPQIRIFNQFFCLLEQWTGEESDRARRNQEKRKEKQKKPLGNTQKEVDPEGTKRNEVSFKEDIGFLMAKHSCARESPRLRLQLSMTPNQEGQ